MTKYFFLAKKVFFDKNKQIVWGTKNVATRRRRNAKHKLLAKVSSETVITKYLRFQEKSEIVSIRLRFSGRLSCNNLHFAF
jgi:hypothetical protein